MTNRIQIHLLDKVSDNAGGFEIAATLLYTVWGNVKYVGSKQSSATEGRVLKFDEYEVEMRIDPAFTVKRQANKLRFTVDGDLIIYPTEHKKEGGNITFVALFTYDGAIAAGSGPTSAITNSDGSYSDVADCGGSLILPDINITKNDDTIITYPASKDLDIGIIDPATPPANWDALVALLGRGYNYPAPTGQTVVYRTGDDAWVEADIFGTTIRAANTLKAKNTLASFYVLNNNNSFGNVNRFTDVNGLQIYGNDYVIDHHTGLGYIDNWQSGGNWNTVIDNGLAATDAGFSDWFAANYKQAEAVKSFGAENTSGRVQNSIFSLNTNNLVTSSTSSRSTTSFVKISGSFGSLEAAKTSSGEFLKCRKHF